MSKDLEIIIGHVLTGEIVHLILNHKAKDRFEELDRVLSPFHLYFIDELHLCEHGSDELVATLISSDADLLEWLSYEEGV
jgi:succinate dehydrogenase flavin-adding protein (antitoxin of CptAB toxin-antitoxin module)